MTYKKILVPLDGSKFAERAIPYARVVAGKTRGEVILLNIAAPGVKNTRVVEVYLKEMARRLRNDDVEASIATGYGDPAERILYSADKNDVDLIVQSAYGQSGLKRWSIGSVARKVLHGTCCPVLLIKPRTTRASRVRMDKILLALDGSAFSEAAVPHVEGLTRGQKAEIVLVRVNEYVVPLERADDLGPVLIREMNKIAERMLAQAEEYAQGMSDSLEDRRTKVTVRIPSGNAAEKILEVARDEAVDLIVMSTHGRSGISRWIHGSVAFKVARESSQPVLLIRPCPPKGD